MNNERKQEAEMHSAADEHGCILVINYHRTMGRSSTRVWVRMDVDRAVDLLTIAMPHHKRRHAITMEQFEELIYEAEKILAFRLIGASVAAEKFKHLMENADVDPDLEWAHRELYPVAFHRWFRKTYPTRRNR